MSRLKNQSQKVRHFGGLFVNLNLDKSCKINYNFNQLDN